MFFQSILHLILFGGYGAMDSLNNAPKNERSWQDPTAGCEALSSFKLTQSTEGGKVIQSSMEKSVFIDPKHSILDGDHSSLLSRKGFNSPNTGLCNRKIKYNTRTPTIHSKLRSTYSSPEIYSKQILEQETSCDAERGKKEAGHQNFQHKLKTSDNNVNSFYLNTGSVNSIFGTQTQANHVADESDKVELDALENLRSIKSLLFYMFILTNLLMALMLYLLVRLA